MSRSSLVKSACNSFNVCRRQEQTQRERARHGSRRLMSLSGTHDFSSESRSSCARLFQHQAPLSLPCCRCAASLRALFDKATQLTNDVLSGAAKSAEEARGKGQSNHRQEGAGLPGLQLSLPRPCESSANDTLAPAPVTGAGVFGHHMYSVFLRLCLILQYNGICRIGVQLFCAATCGPRFRTWSCRQRDEFALRT